MWKPYDTLCCTHCIFLTHSTLYCYSDSIKWPHFVKRGTTDCTLNRELAPFHRTGAICKRCIYVCMYATRLQWYLCLNCCSAPYKIIINHFKSFLIEKLKHISVMEININVNENYLILSCPSYWNNLFAGMGDCQKLLSLYTGVRAQRVPVPQSMWLI